MAEGQMPTQSTDGPALPAPEASSNSTFPASQPALDASTSAAAPSVGEKAEEKPAADTNHVAQSAETENPSDNATVPDKDDAEASAKKKEKRKSFGVPEHKAKKQLNRKKSIVLELDAQPGDYYWVRLKGYPPWPSIICDDSMLPEDLLASRPVTAKRPDGSYREDYQEGGKNVKDRTYPVMYLGTYEFSWAANTSITPLKREEVHVDDAKGKKLSKALQGAYTETREWHSLDHFKEKLAQAAKDREEADAAFALEEERKAQAAAEKKAKKEKKEKRKSKDADGDLAMEDADGATPKDKKPSKKRRKNGDGEDDKVVKTPKTLKITTSNKTPNGDSATKSKAKPKQSSASKAAAKQEPPMSEAEKKDKRQKEILYFRHKLQKGFLTRDVPPKEEDMAQMAQYFENLEKYKDLEGSIVRDTRIYKVLKGILKLSSIPSDEEFKFKERSLKLLAEWNKALGESEPPEGKPEENGTKPATDDDADKPEPKAEPKAEPDSAPADLKPDVVDSKEPASDVAMPDVKPDEAEPAAEEAPKPAAEAEPAPVAA